MSDLATALRLILTGDASGAVAALSETSAATDKLADSTDAAAAKQTEMAKAQAAAVKSARVGLADIAGGAAAIGGAMFLAADASERQAEAIIQVQKLTGMSAKTASEFVVQCQAMGVSIDGLGTLIGRMSKNVEGYVNGTTKSTSAMGKAFAELGLSVNDLKGQNAGQVIDMIREKLSQMPAGLERSSIIQSLFGRGAAGNPSLLRYLTTTQSQLDKINAAAASYGYIFTQQQLDQAASFGVLLRTIELQVKGFAVTAGKDLVPALGNVLKLTSGVLNVFNDILGVFGPLKGYVLAFIGFLPGIALMTVGFAKLYTSVKQLRDMGQSLGTIFQRITGIKLPDWMTKSKTATDAETASTKTNAAAKEGDADATEAQDAALESNDAALTENDAALAANTADLEANDAARGAGGMAGASEDLGSVGVGAGGAGEGAAAGIGLGGAAAIGGIGAGIVAAAIAPAVIMAMTDPKYKGAANESNYLGSYGGKGGAMALISTKPTKYDSGGILPPGLTLAYNATGQNETVAAPGSKGGGETHLHVHLDGANVYGAIDQATAKKWVAPLMEEMGSALYDVLAGARH